MTEQHAPIESVEKANYAGFWQRFGAVLIDGMAIQVVFLLVAVATFFIVPEYATGSISKALDAIFLIVFVAYKPLMESSRYQATIGKMAAGIKVTSVGGEKISIGRAFGRRFAMVLSAIPACLGFVIAAFTAKKQALHDFIAKTVVMKVGNSNFWRIMAITAVLYIAVLASAGYYVAKHLGAWITSGLNSGAVVMGETIKSAQDSERDNKIAAEEVSKNKPILPYTVSEAQYEEFLTTRPVNFTPDPKKPTFFPAKPIALELSHFFTGEKPSQWLEIYVAPEINLGRGGYAMVKINNVLNNNGEDVYDNSMESDFFQKKFDSIINTEQNPVNEIHNLQLKKATKEADIKSVSGTIHLYLPVNPKVISISGADVGKPIVISPDLQIVVQKFGNGNVTFEAIGEGKNHLLRNFYAYNAAAQLLENNGWSNSNNSDKTTMSRQIKGTPTSAQLIVTEKFFEKEYPFTLTK